MTESSRYLLSYPQKLMLEEFWVASGPLWSVGDRILLTDALRLRTGNHASLKPTDPAYTLVVDDFCKYTSPFCHACTKLAENSS
jgi:hypothetical protein